MADVRALLAAERASRQVKHPHLTYSKSGALTCNICNLNIKSEQLWPGHQKSPAHRKNLQRTSEQPIRPAKRKIEALEQEEEEQNKKQKSFESSVPAPDPIIEQPLPAIVESETVDQVIPTGQIVVDSISNGLADPIEDVQAVQERNTAKVDSIDEDEWAAFERDIAPLTRPDYSSATIEAAPISAAELAEQQKANPVQQREDEADAEKEEESRRLEEEFEVMEEMEDRVKRLRDRREALRSGKEMVPESMSAQPLANPGPAAGAAENLSNNDNDDDEDEEEDDWYN